MKILFSANGLSGEMFLPDQFVTTSSRFTLAELAASSHWADHPGDIPTLVTLIDLQNVDGRYIGLFEVRYEERPVFTAIRHGQA